MRLISNSEVESWLTCRRKYWWEYFHELEPKVLSDPLTKGTLIHAMLEGYYAGKQLQWDEEDCVEAAMQPLIEAAAAPFADIAELGQIRSLVEAYFEHYREADEKYEVYAVETKAKADLTDDFAVVGTIDLIVRDMTDGKYEIWDHKSSYNFWTQEQADISGQFPKYEYIVRSMGLDVKASVINQIRTRKLKEGNELFRRVSPAITGPKIERIMDQHLRASTEIMEWRENPDKGALIPLNSKYICGGCNFLDLCSADLSGAPVKYLVASQYQKKTSYGYNKENFDGS